MLPFTEPQQNVLLALMSSDTQERQPRARFSLAFSYYNMYTHFKQWL